jgi:hypothetical protein
VSLRQKSSRSARTPTARPGIASPAEPPSDPAHGGRCASFRLVVTGAGIVGSFWILHCTEKLPGSRSPSVTNLARAKLREPPIWIIREVADGLRSSALE